MLNVIKVKLLSERTSGVPPVIFYQVSTAYVSGWGTLLLNAVCENKLDFLRILLEYGFACFTLDIAKQQF